MAQALIKYLSGLQVENPDGDFKKSKNKKQNYCAGIFAIFGHGNVAGLGEAMYQHRTQLPVYRAHNEQAMAQSAIAFAKANFRKRIMAVTTSIGPGATNLLTAAATAYVNRLPVLLLPGDIYVNRAPDPVLQQVENFSDGVISANDAFKPLVRYFDRIVRPEQLLTALPRAIAVLTDPANCGPVCLALPQDVQAESYDYPESFFENKIITFRRPQPDKDELSEAITTIRKAKKIFLIAGGGVLYAQASAELYDFTRQCGIPVGETQAGKSSLAWDNPLNLGAVGVTGSPAANEMANSADLIIALGTRLQDFTTGSNSLFPQAKILSINAASFDAIKLRGQTLVCDAREGLLQLTAALADYQCSANWRATAEKLSQKWCARVDTLTTNIPKNVLPYDAEVIGAVRDSVANSPNTDIAVCAAGTLPAELHKLWRAGAPGNYHVEYGYSCMGYEIAGGIGVKMAQPQKEVIVMIGDGSYMMMNSEIATSVLLGVKLIIVVLDNRGFGCIQRLQTACGGARLNNLLDDCIGENGQKSNIDFAGHARSMGAEAVLVKDINELKVAMGKARAGKITQVIVINTTHTRTTEDGGWWWEVGIPQVSPRIEVTQARKKLDLAKKGQRQ